MSKPTETTNECVPRDIVRIGTTVGKRRETHGSVGKHTEARGNTRKRGEALPKRAGRSERGDAGAHHVTVNLLKILAAPAYIYGPLLWV
jgi:hypothetical protein